MQSTAFQAHDHSKCVTTALRRAQDTCAARQVRLTPIRQRVLEILLESHRAMGAYDVLRQLSAEGLADKPPVAYRALNFLLEQGLVHRIEKLNAYVACDCPIEDHAPTFLICMACHKVAESHNFSLDDVQDSLVTDGFTVSRIVVEAEGLCAHCHEGENA